MHTIPSSVLVSQGIWGMHATTQRHGRTATYCTTVVVHSNASFYVTHTTEELLPSVLLQLNSNAFIFVFVHERKKPEKSAWKSWLVVSLLCCLWLLNMMEWRKSWPIFLNFLENLELLMSYNMHKAKNKLSKNEVLGHFLEFGLSDWLYRIWW